MNHQVDNDDQHRDGSDPFDLDGSAQHSAISSTAQQPSGWGYVGEEQGIPSTVSQSYNDVTKMAPGITSSNAFPRLSAPASQVSGRRSQNGFPWRRISFAVITLLVLVVLGISRLVAFAHTATPRLHLPGTTTPAKGNPTATIMMGKKQPPPPPPVVRLTPKTTSSANVQSGAPGTQVMLPLSLPDGWINAGLSMGDGMFALRTANAFVDREISYDFRNIGTRNHHAGTFTAATFVLTPGGKQRFSNNDIRVVDNAFFDKVLQKKMIQSVINEVPRIVTLQVQPGQKTRIFAWIDVSFNIWQSHIAQAGGQRVEGVEIEQGTNQPRVHHMIVVLWRVPPDAQGNNPPMGGTSWLVSDYALDTGGTLPPTPNPV